MASAFTRSSKKLKGALIELSERFIGPVPNVITFQFNPETMSRTLEVYDPTSAQSGGQDEASGEASTAQPGDPPETIKLTLEFDAADDLEEPAAHPVAVVSGVAARIAALEMLLYPQEEAGVGGLLGSAAGALGGAVGGVVAGAAAGILGSALGGEPVPRSTVPVLLFAWGANLIVPVRLKSFMVEEQAYLPNLAPVRAKVTVDLKVLTKDDFPPPDPPATRKFSEELAIAAYNYTRQRRKDLAAANIAGNVDAILSMLPF